jgi:membrane protein implicated in regulation of membrane protease activity
MRASTIARGLLLVGALVGAGAGIALALGLGVSSIPSWMITVGMYKLAFIAAGGLLVAGAMVGRAAMRRSGDDDAPSAIGPGPWTDADQAPRQTHGEPSERRRPDGRP